MNVILFSHIVVAVSSLVCAIYAIFKPSPSTLRFSYGLTAATLASGTYIVLSTHTSLTQACTTGLVYLGIMTAGLTAARYRLVRQVN